MTFDNLIRDLNKQIYKPLYFLMGDEPYFIDRITDYILGNVLPESGRAFDQLQLYGRDTDVNTIITSARRYPMMGGMQVIVVKEAQQLRTLEGLEIYASGPTVSTLLVFAYKYKKLDKRTRLYKVLAEKSILFESEKLREDKVPEWIVNYVSSKGIQIEPKASVMLVDFLGNDLGKIVNELDKLLLVIPSNQNKITVDLIEKNIGISKDYNNFELSKALVAKDILKANRIILYFERNPKNNPIILTITSLFYFFSKVLLYHGLTDKSRENVAKNLGINPYFVQEYQQASQKFPLSKTREVIGLLREYDLKSKGKESMATDGDLMKELIFKILH